MLPTKVKGNETMIMDPKCQYVHPISNVHCVWVPVICIACHPFMHGGMNQHIPMQRIPMPASSPMSQNTFEGMDREFMPQRQLPMHGEFNTEQLEQPAMHSSTVCRCTPDSHCGCGGFQSMQMPMY
jgi:hypothetical protein